MLRSPTERPLVICPGMAVRHSMQTAEVLQTCKTDPRSCSRRATRTCRPLFFLGLDAGTVSPRHALSVSGDCKSLPLVPHPTVRNNLQRCWALCHLTLHGQNTQPLEGLNKGLCAWKLWSSNHHIWLIKLNLISITTLFFLLAKSFKRNSLWMVADDRTRVVIFMLNYHICSWLIGTTKWENVFTGVSSVLILVQDLGFNVNLFVPQFLGL